MIKKNNYTFGASLGEGNCVTELNELMSVSRLIHAITVWQYFEVSINMFCLSAVE